jgi:thiamine biosynthesis lipoprotein
VKRAALLALLVGCGHPAPEAPDATVGIVTAPPSRPAPASAPPKAGAAHAVDRVRACMGTRCEILVYTTDEAAAEPAIERGFAELARIEGLVTSWRDTSEIAQINAAAGKAPVKVSPDTLAIIQRGLWIGEISEGGFDITVGVFHGLWKFDQDRDGTLPDPAEVKRRLALVNFHDVILDEAAGTVMLRREGQRLNVEGIAKGYAVDAAVKALRDAGLRDFIVQAGGDLFASGKHGNRDWEIGIQDPRGPHGQIIYQVSLSDRAFNTSGDYERFVLRDGVRYHHILDARTGFPSHASRSVTVLARDAFTADVLDTALFIMGPEKAIKVVESMPDVETVIVGPDNDVHISTGLNGKLAKLRDPTPGP